MPKEYLATNSSTFEIEPDGTLKEVEIATNATDPDYAALRALIGTEAGVAATYSRFAKDIVASWPDFLKACKREGVDTSPKALPDLWGGYVVTIYEALQSKADAAKSAAFEKLRAEAIAENTRAVAAATQLGVPLAEVLGLNTAEPSLLTPAQQRVCKQLGISEASFRAELGQRRR
jgi:hypothetical protein